MISPTGPVSVLRLPFSFILRAVKSLGTCSYSSLEAMNTLIYLNLLLFSLFKPLFRMFRKNRPGLLKFISCAFPGVYLEFAICQEIDRVSAASHCPGFPGRCRIFDICAGAGFPTPSRNSERRI
jgi:hypothetical protein